MLCIETTWTNNFVNTNFVDSDSSFHKVILKLQYIIFCKLELRIGSNFLKKIKTRFEFESCKLLACSQSIRDIFLKVVFEWLKRRACNQHACDTSFVIILSYGDIVVSVLKQFKVLL